MFAGRRLSSSPITTVSCERGEVFRKEELGTRGVMDERRGKQKRRDRVFKTKTHSTAAKTKTNKTGGDVLAQIKAKENIPRTQAVSGGEETAWEPMRVAPRVAPNNGGQRVTISKGENAPSLSSQKVGIYNRGKSSLMVSRRRPLHDLQPSQKTVRETQKDLKRVLGYSGEENSPVKHVFPACEGSTSPPLSSHTATLLPAEGHKQSGSEMELSPENTTTTCSTMDGETVLVVARRIAAGLHPRMVYSDSDYLHNTKSELRKLLKQGVGGGGGGGGGGETKPDMDSLLASSLSNNPPADGVFLLPPPAMAGSEQQHNSFFSLHPFEDQSRAAQPDISSSPDYPMDILQTAALFPSSPPPPPPSPPEAGPPIHLAEVELTTSTYPPLGPVGGDPFQIEPAPSSLSEPPRDFLDLLDTMQHGENPPNYPCLPRPPGAKWLPTPERPPMFPQKLY